MHPKYAETVEKLAAWAQSRQGIRGAVLLGSQVRQEIAGDEWSDLDILLLADEPRVYTEDDGWLAFFGEVVCSTLEETPLDWIHLVWRVKRALFNDHRALDFSIMPAARLDDVLAMNAQIHAGGYQVLYDAQPGSLASRIGATLAGLKEEAPRLPSAEELRRLTGDLLFQWIYACKKIKRGELWVAVSGINQQASTRLLQLLEYHAACGGYAPQRLCYEGRFLEQRVPPSVLAQLPACFARYDQDSAVEAVGCQLRLSRQLVQETCAALGIPFDPTPFDGAWSLFREMFGGS